MIILPAATFSKVRFWGGFASAVDPIRVVEFGVLSYWAVNLELFYLTSCLCRCRLACLRVPGSYLSWIGLHYSIVAVLIRL